MEASIVEQIRASGARLLIADDEQVIRESLKQMGEMTGFDVYTAEDGQEAWESFNENWPDFAILDIYMPKMNGLLLLNKIKEANAECGVILITGYAHYKQLVFKNNIKPDGLITKPFSFEKIITSLVDLVKKAGILEEYNSNIEEPTSE